MFLRNGGSFGSTRLYNREDHNIYPLLHPDVSSTRVIYMIHRKVAGSRPDEVNYFYQFT
jgi:hypothetical protein